MVAYSRPVPLVEREPQLEALASWLAEAALGEGRLVLVGGEVGAGKSALAAEFCSHVLAEITPLWGACEPLSAPRPLGPLLDIAAALGEGIVDLVRDGDRGGAFDATLVALAESAAPRLVVFEDVHWADDATLDLLRFLARRVTPLRVLILATYRDDGLVRSSPLAVLLGDLTSVRSVRRLNVPPLSRSAVAELAAHAGVDPDELYRETNGNAFFVTELLSAGQIGLPTTAADSVLARVARLPTPARAALEAAAVVGPRIEPRLSADIPAMGSSELDLCVDAGLLRFDGGAYSFRHELTRQAVLMSIAPTERRLHHAAVLSALRAAPAGARPLAALAEHAELAEDAAAVLEFAPAAAEAAAGLGAHREAAFQFGRALRFADGLPPSERAELLERRSYECYLIDDLDAAIDAIRQAIELWEQVDDTLRVGDDYRRLSRLSSVFGQRADAERAADRAVELLEQLPPGRELARAYANQATLMMLEDDPVACREWGGRALSLAEDLGDTATVVHVLNSMGAAGGLASDPDGEKLLLEALAIGLEHGLEDEVARSYTNLAFTAQLALDLGKGERYLAAGLAYFEQHDLHGGAQCAQGGLIENVLRQGRWDEAAERSLAMLSGGPTSRRNLEALTSLALVRARRGDPEVWPLLDQGKAMAEDSRELQRLTMVAAARAETHWLAGHPERIADEVRGPYQLAVELAIGYAIGELGIWLWRAGELTRLPPSVADPYRLVVDGDPVGAAHAWRAGGFPYESALALAESSDPSDVRTAIAELDQLGAKPARQLAAKRLRSLGARGVPRGPYQASRSNPAGLTTREVEVLRLLRRGLTDAEIADAMFVSARTVNHHVSAILSKLQVRTRQEAAGRADALLGN